MILLSNRESVRRGEGRGERNALFHTKMQQHFLEREIFPSSHKCITFAEFGPTKSPPPPPHPLLRVCLWEPSVPFFTEWKQKATFFT